MTCFRAQLAGEKSPVLFELDFSDILNGKPVLTIKGWSNGGTRREAIEHISRYADEETILKAKNRIAEVLV